MMARVAAVAAVAIAAVAVVLLLATSGSTYVLHAEFSDAGQLVGGDLVMVGGHKVGSVGAIKLSANGQADVELDISDQSITPLRRGTMATIGQLSLTGVANRFVGLTPGPGTPIPSGGTLSSTQTRGIVDLDTLLDSFTPRVRASLDGLLRAGAYLVSQPTASQLNKFNRYLNPAFSQVAQLGAEVVADKFALQRLVASSAQVSTALASRQSDLGGLVTNTAATFRELAAERTALQDQLERAPAVLSQSTRVLGDVDRTLPVLDPMLADLQPVGGPLARLLGAVIPASQNALPTVNAVLALVPKAEAALRAFIPAERIATPAVRSLTRSLQQILPILAGFRAYVPDVVAGFFNGVAGAEGGNYDANGHYLKGLLTLQGGGNELSGLLNLVGKSSAGLGPFNGERTGLLAPCPGGGNPPAADLSNPWTTPDLPPGTGGICNPADDQRP